MGRSSAETGTQWRRCHAAGNSDPWIAPLNIRSAGLAAELRPSPEYSVIYIALAKVRIKCSQRTTTWLIPCHEHTFLPQTGKHNLKAPQ